MAPETLQIILGAIAALLGGAGLWGFVQYLLSRRSTEAKSKAETGKVAAEADKIEAEARSTDADTIEKMGRRIDALYEAQAKDREKIEQLEAEIRELKRERIETDTEVARLRRTVRYYRSGVKRLIEQLRASGVDPVWEPKDEPADAPDGGNDE